MSLPDIPLLTRFFRKPRNPPSSHSSKQKERDCPWPGQMGPQEKLFLNPCEHKLWQLGFDFDQALGPDSALRIRVNKRSIIRLDGTSREIRLYGKRKDIL